jgi:hypothetical protein
LGLGRVETPADGRCGVHHPCLQRVEVEPAAGRGTEMTLRSQSRNTPSGTTTNANAIGEQQLLAR